MKIVFGIFIFITMLSILFLLIHSNIIQEHNNNELSRESAPLVIWVNDNIEFEEKLINYIYSIKNQNEDNMQTSDFSINKISDINNFYTPIYINKYKLICVAISEHGFVYYYMPNNILLKEQSFSNFIGIEIVIERRDLNSNDIVNYLKEIAQEDVFYTEDGFVYKEDNHIYGQIDKTLFRITVPDDLCDYVIMRDLAFQLKKNAILIDVESRLIDK
ncbi:MAG: hypothetical protein LBC71_04010 [Oscillospiraceae bacterium]|jgi:hypothetical protein|nr:hypothetical protein [Oscillospiraceae bacterium]